MLLWITGFPLFRTEWYFIVYMQHNFFTHASVDRHLGCFYILAIKNNAAMIMDLQISLQDTDLIFLEYGITIFNIWRNHHSFFHNGYINFYSQQYTKVPFSTPPHQYLLSLICFIIVILTRLRWYPWSLVTLSIFSYTCFLFVYLFLRNIYV